MSGNLNRPPDQRIDPKMQQFLTLDDIAVTMKLVLKELQASADEGKEYSISGTATTTIAVIDLVKNYPHKSVSGYTLINDGANNIEFTHNEYIDNMFQATPGQAIPKSYNRKLINRIFVRSIGGDSAYRILLLW